MLSIASRYSLRRLASSRERIGTSLLVRYKSSSLENYTEGPRVAASSKAAQTPPAYDYPFDENGEAPSSEELIDFPAVDRDDPDYNTETKPVLLNAKEHAIGYLSRILNARVYEAAIETDLQHAKNLSNVSLFG